MTTDNTPKHAPQKEAHQYQQCICGNPGFPHCVCGDIEPVFKHCAQQPTAVYPDMHTLWMKHSLEFPGGQRLMRLKDFDKALHEAELRERWISVEDVLEQAAKVCDNYDRDGRLSKEYACETADELAAEIRALKPQPPKVTKWVTPKR